MSQAPIIGITGLARSGKDTTADFIIAAIGGYKYSFADPIRSMLRVLGVDMTDPYWIANKEIVIPALGVSPRHLMQTLGTEWGRRMVNDRIWLTLAMQRLLANGPGMVIPDIRFENEANWVRSLGGRIIRIIRPGTEPVQAHISEAGVEMYDTDAEIFNGGTLDDLQWRVKELLNVN